MIPYKFHNADDLSLVNLSMNDLPPLFLAAAISQDEASAKPLSALTSIGT